MNEELQEMLRIYEEACEKMDSLPAEEIFEGLMGTLVRVMTSEDRPTSHTLFVFLGVRYGAVLGQKMEWATHRMQAVAKAMDVNVRLVLAGRFKDLDLAIEAMQQGRELLKDPELAAYLKRRFDPDDE